MGLPFRSLAMLVVLIWLSRLAYISAQLASGPLDVLLQDYAFRAFVHPKTGVPYDAQVPSNLTGIQIAALRLRSGSLYRRGVVYKEFEFPKGVDETPYAERLVLVYQNLGNWSMAYYPLPGHSYLAPVLGLLAYDAIDLSAKNLPYLDIKAGDNPIKIKFQDVKPHPDGSVVKCVTFNLDGTIDFSDVGSGNTCSAVQQGHFSIVVEFVAPAPSPVTSITPPSPAPGGRGKKKSNSKTWIIVGSVLGGLALLALLAFLVLWVRKCRERKHLEEMEKAADLGEALHMTTVGDTKAPSATVTRTQPTIEHDYVP
ncbi:uncharacterized protein LOC126799050 [Argentina anserina]|uniref:uncharacterized protein LOC126799050 n=1 Tax=Argentina anserina TaxID=57926 RepID=UPI0021765610|nr:uncharacterized protein LOC126799050 [Potentilla anserina]